MMFRKPLWLALLGLLLLPFAPAHARELPLAPAQAAVASAILAGISAFTVTVMFGSC